MVLVVTLQKRANVVCKFKPSNPSFLKTTSIPTNPSNVPKVIFSGIQPSGVPHLGNYLGVLRQWVQLQNKTSASTKLFFSVVDLHALTSNAPPTQLKIRKRQTLATLLALGLDPKRCTLFYQSAVPAHAELMWILSCSASVGYLSRMTQWKSKLSLTDEALISDSSSKARLKLGLFSYPVLQAADILLYRASHVPVGQDQIQHVEFARECANKFNIQYTPIFEKPKLILSPAKRIMSLKEPHLKMSKSHSDPRSRIELADDPEDIYKKISLALTDSLPGISYDPQKRPGVSSLLDVVRFLSPGDLSVEQLLERYGSLNMREFKAQVAAEIVNALSEIRIKYQDLISEGRQDFLDDLAMDGALKARNRAEETMAEVRQAIGL